VGKQASNSTNQTDDLERSRGRKKTESERYSNFEVLVGRWSVGGKAFNKLLWKRHKTERKRNDKTEEFGGLRLPPEASTFRSVTIRLQSPMSEKELKAAKGEETRILSANKKKLKSKW